MFKDAGFCTSPPPDEHFNISNGMIVSGSVFQGQVFWYSEIMKTYENIWEHVLRIPNCYLVLVWVYNCLTIIRKTGDEKIQNLQSTKPPIRIYSLGAGHSGGWRPGLFFILQQQVEHSAEPSTVIEVMRSFQLFADSFQLLRFVKISNSQYLQLSLIHSPAVAQNPKLSNPTTDLNGSQRTTEAHQLCLWVRSSTGFRAILPWWWTVFGWCLESRKSLGWTWDDLGENISRNQGSGGKKHQKTIDPIDLGDVGLTMVCVDMCWYFTAVLQGQEVCIKEREKKWCS